MTKRSVCARERANFTQRKHLPCCASGESSLKNSRVLPLPCPTAESHCTAVHPQLFTYDAIVCYEVMHSFHIFQLPPLIMVVCSVCARQVCHYPKSCLVQLDEWNSYSARLCIAAGWQLADETGKLVSCDCLCYQSTASPLGDVSVSVCAYMFSIYSSNSHIYEYWFR